MNNDFDGEPSEIRRILEYYRGLKCSACFKQNDPYMLKREIWRMVNPVSSFDRRTFLCLACVEHILSRHLTVSDFQTEWPINNWIIRKLENKKGAESPLP